MQPFEIDTHFESHIVYPIARNCKHTLGPTAGSFILDQAYCAGLESNNRLEIHRCAARVVPKPRDSWCWRKSAWRRLVAVHGSHTILTTICTPDPATKPYFRLLVTARIPTLISLDGGQVSIRPLDFPCAHDPKDLQITKAERKESEIFYLSFILKLPELTTDEERAREHPRWYALCSCA